MLDGKFRVPSYYKYFKCKCGECRNCCCSGWNITLTMKDYARLMNLECSNELRNLISNGVSMFSHATNERYAKIDMNYFGECKLRLENGWCGLQCEVGEENIPSVCRYYPRGIRKYPYLACSISNSCEWVIEYFAQHKEPITFEELNLSFDIDKEENIKIYPKDFNDVQNEIFSFLNLNDISKFFDFLQIKLGLNYKQNSDFEKNVLEELYKMYAHSYSIGSYIESKDVNNINEFINSIDSDKISVIKNVLINHMYYYMFPYCSSDLNMEYSFYGLYFIYLFWMSLVIGNLDQNFVDLSANFFRVAEHANMYDIIYNFVKKYKKVLAY